MPLRSHLKARLSYGWIAAVAGAFVLLSTSNFQYIFGVFLKPMVDGFGWSRASVSGVASLRSVVFGGLSPILGSLSDRYGPRMLIAVGILLSGLAYVLASQITELWQAYVFFGLLSGIATAAGYPAALSTVTRWFGGRSSLANGIVLTGFGMSQMLLPPLATYLLANYGWSFTVIAMGLGVWLVGAAAWRFVRSPSPAPGASAANRQGPPITNAMAGTGDYSLRQAARTRQMWVLFPIYAAHAFSFQLVTVHIVAAGIDAGMEPGPAAIILSMIGVTNTAGRLLFGWLARWAGNRTTMIGSLAAQAPVLIMLALTRQPAALYVLALVYGLAYGGLMPLVPSVLRDMFGTRALGAIFGIMNTAYSAGMAIGPYAGGYIFDVTGSYLIAFMTAGVLMAAAFGLALTLRPPASMPRGKTREG